MTNRTFAAASSILAALTAVSACTSIIGDGFVIEDEDDTGGVVTGGAECAEADFSGDCTFCLECWCGQPIIACYDNFSCSACIEFGFDDPSCDPNSPELNVLAACITAACPTACEA